MHEKFHYKTLDEIKQTAAALGVALPFAADTHALAESLRVGKHVFPNRLGIAPMEGADSLPDGSPSDFTARRYLREAKGGSAIIWFEAISIVPEGRSSATQLYLCRENLDSYKRLTQAVKEAGLQVNGFAPYLVMQANHSGRYSNPDNKPAPIIAYRHPELEQYRAADNSFAYSGTSSNAGGWDVGFRVSQGYIYHTYEDAIVFAPAESIADVTDDSKRERFNMKGVKIYVYDKNDTRTPVYVGSKADLRSYLKNKEKAPKVYIRSKFSNVETILVVK